VATAQQITKLCQTQPHRIDHDPDIDSHTTAPAAKAHRLIGRVGQPYRPPDAAKLRADTCPEFRTLSGRLCHDPATATEAGWEADKLLRILP
jgi:hypothetical protein